MTMGNFATTPRLVPLLLFLTVMRNIVGVVDGSCPLEMITGGCPDEARCADTCRPCYVGVGLVYAYCVPPGGGINWWRCRCDFEKGAPCQPIGCPKPPAVAPATAAHNLTHH